MIKLIGAVLLIGSTSLIGIIFSKRLLLRKEFLQDFESFLGNLETYIRYDNSKIETIVEKSITSESLYSLKNICRCENNDIIMPFSMRWNSWVKGLSPLFGLTKEDKKSLLEFGALLGTTDIDGQIKHIELYKSLFAKAVKSAQINITEKSRLYKMFGFCIGAVIALIIV